MKTAARTPVLVKGPYPTMEEVAKTMGVTLSRAREIEKLVDEIHERHKKKRRHKKRLRERRDSATQKQPA